MLDKLQNLCDSRLVDRVVDSAKVWTANGVALALVNLLSLRSGLELLSIGLSIAYTIWRWRRDSKKG